MKVSTALLVHTRRAAFPAFLCNHGSYKQAMSSAYAILASRRTATAHATAAMRLGRAADAAWET